MYRRSTIIPTQLYNKQDKTVSVEQCSKSCCCCQFSSQIKWLTFSASFRKFERNRTGDRCFAAAGP